MGIQDQLPREPYDFLTRIASNETVAARAEGLSAGTASLLAIVQTKLATLASSGTTWVGPVASPSTVTAAGAMSAGGGISSGATVSGTQGTFSSGLNSVGAYNTDVSLIPGARQTVWQHNSGVYGFAPSSMRTKTNLGPVPFTAADVRAVSPYVFQYKAQLAIRDEPESEYFDPDYVVPWEIGLMAEHLIEHNMSCFVFWEEDGVTPRGINYDLFGAIAPLVVLADFERRFQNAGL